MAEEINSALTVLNDRKEVLGTDRDDGTFSLGPAEMRALLSGFDLDPEELTAAVDSASAQGCNLFNGIIDPRQKTWAFGLMFLDGLAVGLVIAERRAKAEASA